MYTDFAIELILAGYTYFFIAICMCSFILMSGILYSYMQCHACMVVHRNPIEFEVIMTDCIIIITVK